MSFLVAVLLCTMCLNWLSAIFPGHPLSLCRGRTSKVSSTADIVFTGTWGGLPPSDSWQQCHLWGVMSLSGALSSLVLSPHLLLYLWCSCLWSHFPYVPLFTCVWMWDVVSPQEFFPVLMILADVSEPPCDLHSAPIPPWDGRKCFLLLKMLANHMLNWSTMGSFSFFSPDIRMSSSVFCFCFLFSHLK